MAKAAEIQIPADEVQQFRSLLEAFALPAEAFALHEKLFLPDFGPAVRIVCVNGPACGRYSRADGVWLDQLQRDLHHGLYAPMPHPPMFRDKRSWLRFASVFSRKLIRFMSRTR
jgi:hypothetical protein